MTSQNTTTATEAREGQDHAEPCTAILVPDLGVTAARFHTARLYVVDMRGTEETVALVHCACGWHRQSQYRRADVADTDPSDGPWIGPWDDHVGRAIGLDIPDDRGIECSRITWDRYPGQTEILAKWMWAVSPEGTPITANARDGLAMDLAYQAFAERDAARSKLTAATEAVAGQLAITRGELDALRAREAAWRDEVEELRSDLTERALERNEAEQQRDKALAALADENTLHAECAWGEDLEAQKKLTKAAEADAKRLRTQRTVILVAAGVVIVVLAVAAVIGALS